MLKTSRLLVSLCLLLIWSCATTQADRKGCMSKKWWPSKTQWCDATKNAISHPGTWVPMFGATVVAVGSWDRQISDWAVRTTPVFGSQKAAQEASDFLCSSAHIGMIATSLAVPSNNHPWLLSTTERLFWEHTAVFIASYVTDPIKRFTDRDRPHGGKRSFPSWHATRTAAYAGMGYRNLDLINIPSTYRYSAQFLLASFAVGTAWARVEAQEHYPTDVLVGAALGNFVAILVHDVFLGENNHNKAYVQFDWNGTMRLAFDVRF